MKKKMQTTSVEQFKSILGEQNLSTCKDEMKRYLVEPRGLFHGEALMVLRPQNVEQIASIVKIAKANTLKIIPQGGNTGLVGGQIASDSHSHIVLSLEKMNQIREIDLSSNSITVEAGMILENLQNIAEDQNRFFPLHLASQGSCQIGGNLATNAGGVNVLSYGNMRDLCLGLEVVTANGEIWNGLRKLKKDNRGYDLRDLFIGSEGTLGIITASVLKLFPKPKQYHTAFLAVETPEAAINILNILQENYASQLTSYELISKFAVEVSQKHQHAKTPFALSSPWYVLLEISELEENVNTGDSLETLLSQYLELGDITNAVIAQNQNQRTQLWYLREAISEAQKGEGGSIKHDISLPLNTIPEFLSKAETELEKYMNGIRPCPFGHLGDGNLHYNVSQPTNMDRQEFLSHWEKVNEIIFDLVKSFNGSFSAEHGIGSLKRDYLARDKSSVEMAMMRSIKHALDPENIFNPGKVLKI